MSFRRIHKNARSALAVLIAVATHSVLALSDANSWSSDKEPSSLRNPVSFIDSERKNQLEDIYLRSHEAMEQGKIGLGVWLLHQAAEGGYVLAMHDLALQLRSGTIIPRDYAGAARWYRRAAEWGGTGFAGSQNNLGDMYENGQGVQKSSADAVYWYTRAALQGEPTAYLSLGICFADGIGVAKDTVEGYFWLSLAVENLHEGSNRTLARRKLHALEKWLLPEQVEAAITKVKAYRPYIQTQYTIGDPFE